MAIVDWNARHRVASGTGAPTGTWDPTETTATDDVARSSPAVRCSSTVRLAGDRMTEITLPLGFLRHAGLSHG
ncbi:MAG: hypothetical protein ACLUQ6_03905 [Alistipes onderdonkii]